MSTRWTIDHGDGHHLFLDIFEPGKVYLTLNDAEFEARPGTVTVAIPADLWDRLRAFGIDQDVWWTEQDERDDAGSSEAPR